MAPRFPFPSFPRGWYVVAFSSDIVAGAVETLHYFGQDIVVFRTESGVVSAVDKTCPHLGAHLGGGRVEGECLRCPFHAWAFDAAGQCTHIPYASKIPPKASLRTWPVREQNGAIFVFYDPSGRPPSWQLEPLPEEGWTPNRSIRWEIRSHPQEIAENTVDCAHLLPVHQVISASIVSLEQQNHFMRVVLHMVASGAVIQMPDEINDVELDVTLHGLGQLISNTHVLTAGLRTRQRIHPTPIDDKRVAIFALGNTREMPDPEYTREIDEIFWNAFVADFAKDFPIWENKAYLERPLLASGDGPVGKYRRWARQFYDQPQVAASASTATATTPTDRVRPLGVLGAWLERAKSVTTSVLASRSPAGADLDAAEFTPHADANVNVNTSAQRPAPAQAHFASIEAYFDELERRFDPNAAGDLVAVYQWLLTGDAPRAHFAEIERGRIRAAAGTHTAPTVTIQMSAADYLLMINGELNGALAFSTGRGKLRGPVRLAMKMKSLFPLERVL
jgi:phenylpropionate dioxygenase-like ring-hydroxylating dioxygenase large terminal subunit